jgi:hypothetical protein
VVVSEELIPAVTFSFAYSSAYCLLAIIADHKPQRRKRQQHHKKLVGAPGNVSLYASATAFVFHFCHHVRFCAYFRVLALVVRVRARTFFLFF